MVLGKSGANDNGIGGVIRCDEETAARRISVDAAKLTMTEEALIDPTQGIAPETVAPEAPGVSLRHFALKHGDAFQVCDARGDICGAIDGFFRNDTRVLSRLALTLGGCAPSLLAGTITADNVFFVANAVNLPLPPLGGAAAPSGVIHVERTRFLWDQCLYERITLGNYGDGEIRVPLSIGFAADFHDLFEVRGTRRLERGTILPPLVDAAQVLLRYEGLDHVARNTVISFSPKPCHLSADCADFILTLPARGEAELYLEVRSDASEEPSRARFRDAAARARVAMRAIRQRGSSLRSSQQVFTDWIGRSRADLALLTSDLPSGPYPYAGIPWFSTTFGRDAIITALQTLWLDPALARGVLAFLARTQARESSAFRDASPGKIVHEMRKGEMAATGEVPFACYYGGVDTTPLFVMLAGAYAERTGDMAFIAELWPALEAAMAWIEGSCDSDRDGFLVYARGEETGLANQGWKDSHDSIFHADGTFPRGPIALVEVQGYVYAARRAMAVLAQRRDALDAAAHWLRRAGAIRAAVEASFWMEERGFYGIALDGAARLCRVAASNAGHLLYVGVPARERAVAMMQLLGSPRFNTGWGIRTLAEGEARFNPMSYHNGSVWPHDGALCVAGLARYGDRAGAVRLLGESFAAAAHFGLRMPELFCGFARKAGEPPVSYPVACLPQAWSAGSAFMLLQACLGVRIDGFAQEIHIDRPALPEGIDRLALTGLVLGEARVDIVFQRVGDRIVTFSENDALGVVRVFTRS
jgi:glycogen debranching enzyme